MLASRDDDPVLVLPSLKLTDATGDCVDENVFTVLNVTEPLEEKLGTLDVVRVPLVDEDMVGVPVVVADKEVDALADCDCV